MTDQDALLRSENLRKVRRADDHRMNARQFAGTDLTWVDFAPELNT